MNQFDRSNTKRPQEDSRKSAILRYVRSRVIDPYFVPPTEETSESREDLEDRLDEIADVKAYFSELDPQDKAEMLYEKLMAFVTDRKAFENKQNNDPDSREEFVPDQHLVTEMKLLMEDPQATKLFSEIYSQARQDDKTIRKSPLRQRWEGVRSKVEDYDARFRETERSIFLKKHDTAASMSSAGTRAERYAKKLLALKSEQEEIESLKLPGVEAVVENTDPAAMFQYETLLKYQKQLADGFIWLPSRVEIQRQVIGALQNGRWPVLVGEAGTGKSELADAAAVELTGSRPLEVQCGPSTGEKQLIGDSAIDETGRSYVEYGPVMQAFTGLADSRQSVPEVDHGRIVRLDEFGMMGGKAYALLKQLRMKGAGDSLNGKTVLAGAAAIGTTNPVGLRYPDRHALDPAMRREFADIVVGYTDQSNTNPELYEAMLTGLLDQNGHIVASENELSPAYKHIEIPEEKRRTLADGSVVIAEDKLIEDGTDASHGTLWRLANAVKALQDAFVSGNAPDTHPQDALRFKLDSKGNMQIGKEGEVLTLSTSTITIGEVMSWMRGFKQRLQKQDKSFQVPTLSQWIKLKLETYAGQVEKADREKVMAIFDHFHLFDGPPNRRSLPLTPKRIGYLSPRVPRPLYVERPVVEDVPPPEPEKAESEAARLYEEVEVTLESGETIKIKKGPGEFKTIITDAMPVKVTERIRVDEQDFSFVGATAKGNSPVCSSIAENALHRVFTPEEVELGKIEYAFQQCVKDTESICSATAT